MFKLFRSKLILGATIFAVAAGGAACTRSAPPPTPAPAPTQAPVPQPTVEPPQTPTPGPSTPANSCATTPPVQGDTPQERYIDAMRHCKFFDQATDAELLNLGNSICGAFDDGATFEQVAQALLDANFPEYEAGWTIGASVIFLCPRHTDKLPNNLKQLHNS